MVAAKKIIMTLILTPSQSQAIILGYVELPFIQPSYLTRDKKG